MNSVFQRLRDGEKLEDAVKNSTGTELADIVKSINQTGTASENAEAVTFVRKLTYAATANRSKGAGSVITPSLSTGGSAILANTATPATSPLNIDTSKVNYPETSSGGSGIQSYGNNGISLHVGADSYSSNKVDLLLFRLDTEGLGLEETNTRTTKSAYKAMDEFQGALSVVSFVRSYYGAVQNRLEHTIRNLGNIVENTTSAESAIRDTNMADEMVRFSNLNILQQAGQSMLTQANQSRDFILSLLG
ncbi:MAG: hypothetical protein IJU93_04135 [Lachnospiraceae bacterium]|nr:hypothetical protein [Lachnospiraceae bacterium]